MYFLSSLLHVDSQDDCFSKGNKKVLMNASLLSHKLSFPFSEKHLYETSLFQGTVSVGYNEIRDSHMPKSTEVSSHLLKVQTSLKR